MAHSQPTLLHRHVVPNGQTICSSYNQSNDNNNELRNCAATPLLIGLTKHCLSLMLSLLLLFPFLLLPAAGYTAVHLAWSKAYDRVQLPLRPALPISTRPQFLHEFLSQIRAILVIPAIKQLQIYKLNLLQYAPYQQGTIITSRRTIPPNLNGIMSVKDDSRRLLLCQGTTTTRRCEPVFVRQE